MSYAVSIMGMVTYWPYYNGITTLWYQPHPIHKHKRFSSRLAVVFAKSIEATCSVENEDVVGAAPTGDAPTTSEWSTKLLPAKVHLILETLRYLIMSPIHRWLNAKSYVTSVHQQWSYVHLALSHSCIQVPKLTINLPKHSWQFVTALFLTKRNLGHVIFKVPRPTHEFKEVF